MTNAIILHGTTDKEEYFNEQYPSLSNAHWLPWLQKQLLVNGIEAATPEVFNAYEPVYDKWLNEFNRYHVDPDTILVGHSCGGGFLLRWLTEHPESRVGWVVLVAPWLDPERAKTTDFFDFEIDPGIVARTKGLTIFYSDNDDADVQASIVLIRNALPGATCREFHNYGHFCFEDMGTDAFPELRDVILASE